MNIIKSVTAVLVSAVISVPAMAETWEARSVPHGGMAYIGSERFENTGLVFYAETTRNCDGRLVVMDSWNKGESEEAILGKQFGKLRIDGGTIWENDEVVTYRSEDKETGTLFSSITTLEDGDELLNELKVGNNLIVQVAKQQSDKFSLTGFTKAYYEAVASCGKALVESNAEWDTEYTSEGEWES